MKVEYIYRPPSAMVSIEKGFDSVIRCITKHEDIIPSKSFVKPFAFWPFTIIYNMVRYGLRSRCHRIFHITGDIQYVGCFMNSKRTIMTVHDCVVLHNEAASWFYKNLVYYLWYYLPLKHLKYICCISEETRKDLVTFFPWVEHKLTVVPSPVSDKFYNSPKQYNIKCPRILHVGTRDNKNLPRVIQALEGLNCHLRIIGKLTEENVALLKSIAVDYSNDYNITDEQIVQEYIDADMISFPSLFEGFGMPIVEAQLVGRPVVTSDKEPMKTVGKGAMLVNPESVESIREGFCRIMNSKEIWEQCVSEGLNNCQQYTAEKVADKYYELYHQMTGEYQKRDL